MNNDMFKLDDKIKIVEYFILAILLAFVFLLVYSPHLQYNYSYPLHYDEWLRIGAVKNIVDNGFNSVLYAGQSSSQAVYLYFIIGFDIFVSQIVLFSDIDLVALYQFLPAVFAVFTALTIFILVKNLSKNFYAGFLAIIFFAFLKSNIYILGNWFFLPFTFSFFFFFLILFCLSKYDETRDNKFLFLFLTFSLVLIVSYPLTLIFLLPVIFVYFAIYFDLRKLIKYFFVLALLIMIALFSFFLVAFKYSDYTFVDIPFATFLIVKGLIFSSNWSGFLDYSLSLPALFGYFSFSLSLYALFVFAKNKKNNLFLFIFFWILINLLLYRLFSFTLLLYYQRVVYLGMLISCVLAAMGFYYMLKSIGKFIEPKRNVAKSLVFVLIMIIMLTLSLAGPVRTYYNVADNFDLVKIIQPGNFESFSYIKNNYQNKIVLAPALYGPVIYPVANQTAAFLPIIDFVKKGIDYYDPYYNFTSKHFNAQKKIAELYNVDLVFSPHALESQILKPVYVQEGNFIYEIIK